MRVEALVIGAGVAGLATALALRQAGFHSEVWERSPRPVRAGMGFLLMENGLAALSRLGLADRVRERGVIATGSAILQPDGTTIEARTFAPHLGMARWSLIELLLEELPTDVVEYGREIDRFDHAGESVRMNDDVAISRDLFVGADGQRSTVRNFVAPGHGATRGNVAELISSVEAPDIVEKLGSTLIRVRHPDGGLGAGLVPTSPSTLVWYLTHDTSRWTFEDDERGRRALAERASGWPWPFPELVRRTDFAESYVWRTADMEPLSTLFRDNVVLVGDAAHPLLPFSTQGVNSALVDAVTLSDSLSTGKSLDEALNDWSLLRSRVLPVYLDYGRARASTFLDPVNSPNDPPFPEAAGRLDIQNLTTPQEQR